MRITEASLKKLTPRDKKREVRDDSLKGFLVRVMPTGSITFYCNPARGVWKRIGVFPTMPVSLARDTARKLILKHQEGIDIRPKRAVPYVEFLKVYRVTTKHVTRRPRDYPTSTSSTLGGSRRSPPMIWRRGATSGCVMVCRRGLSDATLVRSRRY